MSSLQLPGVAPSKDIRHFFPTLDAEQLAAKRRKDALQEQLDAAADVEGSAARAAAAAARKKPVGRPRKEQELQACDDADGTAAAPGAGAAGAAVAGRRGPYTDWFPPGLFDPILEQVRAEPRPRVCDASRGLLLPSSLSCVWSRSEAAAPAALLLLDLWCHHRSAEFRTWVEVNYPWIKLVYIPGGCTGKVQPADVGLNRPVKVS
jgi:hypothetical protein